ncbi:hypothetical protein BHE74_00026690 [Ensete ventricosum]|nr:hypothetical protein BHE74_00026690 [Ensete ventricosum]
MTRAARDRFIHVANTSEDDKDVDPRSRATNPETVSSHASPPSLLVSIAAFVVARLGRNGVLCVSSDSGGSSSLCAAGAQLGISGDRRRARRERLRGLRPQVLGRQVWRSKNVYDAYVLKPEGSSKHDVGGSNNFGDDLHVILGIALDDCGRIMDGCGRMARCQERCSDTKC